MMPQPNTDANCVRRPGLIDLSARVFERTKECVLMSRGPYPFKESDIVRASRPARRRRVRVDALIRQAEKAGKVVTSITTPDGITLRFSESKQDGSNLEILTADDELAQWRKRRGHAHFG
jgi:hypothetical protein